MILKFAVLGEGTSDSALIPFISRVITDISNDVLLDPFFTTPKSLGGGVLTFDLVIKARDIHDADIVFLHKDGDSFGHDVRVAEIDRICADLSFPVIAVVPVREMETWLLLDESAIRIAANNRNGAVRLNIPRPARAESIRDPKSMLFDLLRVASDLPPSRRGKFDVKRARARTAEVFDAYNLLRSLSSFASFEERTRSAVAGIIDSPS